MSTDDNGLYFLPLGGSGEIGMNLNLYGYGPEEGRKWIMVDLGVTFGDLTTPGVDIIMPDPAYIEERASDLLGIVLTHAHEDHMGALAHLWERFRCPVYATPFTVSVLRRKLSEAGLEDQVPIVLFWLGAADPEKYEAAQRGERSLPSLHSSKFAPPPEPTIKTGVLAMTAAVLELLGSKGPGVD